MKSYSVTTVLSTYSDFSGIPENVLEAAAERGTVIHSAIAAHLRGLWFPALPSSWQGYLDSFHAWHKNNVSEVLLVEKALEDKAIGFFGHVDCVCRFRGASLPAVVDFKTPAAESKTWRAQLAAYRHLVEHDAGIKTGAVIALRLRSNGGPALASVYETTAQDFAAFCAALMAHRYFKQEGI